MSGTQNSISSLVAQFLRLQKNSIEIINGLNEVATSTNDTVQIEMLLVRDIINVEYGTFVGFPNGYLPTAFVRNETLKSPGII